MSAASPFEIPLRPEPSDIDGLGHVNNIVYVRWIQDVATAHWLAISSAEERAQLAWVVVRHEIDYKAAAILGDALVGRTWVDDLTAATCARHTEIARPADGRTLVLARTSWCAVTPASGRPRRIPDEMRARFAL